MILPVIVVYVTELGTEDWAIDQCARKQLTTPEARVILLASAYRLSTFNWTRHPWATSHVCEADLLCVYCLVCMNLMSFKQKAN